MELKDRKVVVFGMAASGRAAARLAVERGAQVVGVDQKLDVAPISGVMLELGPSKLSTFESADLVVVSPGVPATAAELQAAVAAGVPVIGELSFAASFLKLDTVAISGTNGKSTVTWFTGQLLQACGRKPFVGGNFGRPLSEAAFAENADAFDCAVVEVSSYQMEWRNGSFQPRAAAIINLTPDHLARHGDMDQYGAMKCRLFENMGPTDLAFVPPQDERLVRLSQGIGRGQRAWIGRLPGVERKGDAIALRWTGVEADFDLSKFDVPGEHNRDNAALAAALTSALGGSGTGIQQGLAGLRALPHRMEVVHQGAGITWINDSKATNVAATQVGIRGLHSSGVLLLGGQAKGDAFSELVPFLKPWRVITFGGSGPQIAEELEAAGAAVTRAGSMKEAVEKARQLARAGEVVLLSPGCASFDEFKNFEHRGQVFRELAQGSPA